MREIKFRAFVDGRMQYGGFSIHATGSVVQAEGEITLSGGKAEIANVMQYTGVKDKDGIEIYEGDIVCIIKDKFGFGRHEVWSIEYGYFGDAAFYVQNQINSGRLIKVDEFPSFSPDGTLNIELEIIGNIHQNPELLEESQ